MTVLVFGAPAYFVASFAPGMALAGTYLTSGADHSRWGSVLHLTSALALLSLIVIGIASAIHRGRRAALAD